MRLLRMARILVVGLLFLPAGGLSRADDGSALAAADAAYAAEDYARALELYDEVLDSDAENLRALIRSARVLSWDGRLSESIDRYDAALAVDPDDRPAALGRAVVLSWDGRLDRAVEELEKLAARFPGDREIELALARTLAWNGEFVEAREHYDALLARDPGDLEAMLGIARTHGWAGDLSRAGDGYDRVLALDPDNKDARVGQGYLALWMDDLGRAEQSAALLETRYPDDRDVREFSAKVHRAAAPSLRVQTDRTDDTDDNRLEVHRATARWSVARGVRLDAGVARYEMEDPAGSASIDNLNVAVHWSPGPGQALSAHAAVDRRKRSNGESASDALGGVGYRRGLDRRWQFGARAAREAVRYSPVIADNGITFDEVELSARGTVGSRFRIELYAGGADFSDGNSRNHLIGAASYRWPVSALALETGYLFRHLDYDQDLQSGYFDPSGFSAHIARLHGKGTFGPNKNGYSFGADVGLQSFTAGGVRVSNDSVLVLSGTLSFPLGREVTLELFGSHGDYAAQTSAGFESRQLGLRFLWQFGQGAVK